MNIKQLALLGFIAVSVPSAYIAGLLLAVNDQWLPMFVAVVVFSPLAMYGMRALELSGDYEHALQIFTPTKQSWAFMFGDTFLLSTALLALTRGWQQIPQSSAFQSIKWVVMAGVLGILLSVVFRMVDRNRYISCGAKDALNSPTKLWHDGAVFPVLLSLLLFTGIPQIVVGVSTFTMAGVASILGFIALCVMDMLRDKRGSLRARDQHFEWDCQQFHIKRIHI